MNFFSHQLLILLQKSESSLGICNQISYILKSIQLPYVCLIRTNRVS